VCNPLLAAGLPELFKILLPYRKDNHLTKEEKDLTNQT
jgi:hypothetical protein